MLTKQLTIKEQHEILNTLFGFSFVNVNEENKKLTDVELNEHWVLYDEEGYEFYGKNENCKFNFSTLAGIFSYTAHRAKEQGYYDCQYAIRKVLAIN